MVREFVEPVISLRNVSLTTDPGNHDETETHEGKVTLLEDLTFDIPSGQMVLLTGPSGAGKSSLIRVLNGLVPHVIPGCIHGQIRVDQLTPSSVELSDAGFVTASVFQNPRTQFFATDVLSELAFGAANHELPREEILRRIDTESERLGLTSLLARHMNELSGGERQRVSCASAMVHHPRVFLFDEPTANLDQRSTLAFAAALRELRHRGATILIAEHRLSYLNGLVDRVIEMEKGRIVRDLPAEDFWARSEEERVATSLRRFTEPPCHGVDGQGAIRIRQLGEGTSDDAGATDELAGLTLRGVKPKVSPSAPKLWEIGHAQFPSSAVTCVIGGNGVGKTTLMRVIAGLQKSSGEIRCGDRVLNRVQRRKRTATVLQDVNSQLFAGWVSEELELSRRGPLVDHRLRSGREFDERETILSDLGLGGMQDRHPLSLSGGQRQRLAVATARMSRADVVIFDEPTSGLDLASMRGMAGVIRSCADEGSVVIVITHDHELIDEIADHIFELTPALER